MNKEMTKVTMNLIDMRLPNVNRIQFANKESLEIWGEKINQSRLLYPKLEVETVKHDLRKCMISHRVTPDRYDEYARNFAKQGLVFVPIVKEGQRKGGFSHVSSQYEAGKPFSYRAVVAKTTQDAEDLIHATLKNDDIAVGHLLGFPFCCSSFFDKEWKNGYHDPIWQQAVNTKDARYRFVEDKEFGINNKHILRLKAGYSEIHSVFRYIGVTILSHMPCSFDCDESLEVANQWIDLARQEGFEGLDETLEIMSLPFEWDAYKGLAIINTPVFKLAVTSMNCYPHYIVQKESNFYPKEASNGLQFPWRNPLFGGEGLSSCQQN